MAKCRPKNWIVGRWLIESMEQWDRDFIDEERATGGLQTGDQVCPSAEEDGKGPTVDNNQQKEKVTLRWEKKSGETFSAPNATNSRRLAPARASHRPRASPQWFVWAERRKADEERE